MSDIIGLFDVMAGTHLNARKEYHKSVAFWGYKPEEISERQVKNEEDRIFYDAHDMGWRAYEFVRSISYDPANHVTRLLISFHVEELDV